MHRIFVTTTDGRSFRGPLIEDDADQQGSFDRFSAAVEKGDLPDWLPGVTADDVATWSVIPGPRYKPRNVRPSGKGAVKATIAVWPDPARGYVATPVEGVAAGNLHTFGETEHAALMAAANMLDVLRERSLDIKSNLPPEVLEGLRTKPEEQPEVKYFRLEIERGNRFHFEPTSPKAAT